MGYSLMVLLTDDSELSLDELALRLKTNSALRGAKIASSGPAVTVAIGQFKFTLTLRDDKAAASKAAELVTKFASDRKDKKKIAACKRIVELASDDDEAMDRFDDYVVLMDELEGFKGTYTFDPEAGEFV